jgi:hypothetical protein
MNKTMLLLIAISIGLSAQADYVVQTNQPLYPAQIAQPQIYSTNQNYQQYPQYQQPQQYQPYQTYNQGYNPAYNQGYYQNPYQTQYQGQIVNPYAYQNQYGYGNNLPPTVVTSALSGLGNAGGTPSVLKNIVQSVIFSKLRGY